MGGSGHPPCAAGEEPGMAAIGKTTAQLLYELREACYASAIVSHIEELLVDLDVLKVRVYLTINELFISVFYNVTTGKAAYALLKQNLRIYGIDNAKMGWHIHPFWAPDQHHAISNPVPFTAFLSAVEKHFS